MAKPTRKPAAAAKKKKSPPPAKKRAPRHAPPAKKSAPPASKTKTPPSLPVKPSKKSDTKAAAPKAAAPKAAPAKTTKAAPAKAAKPARKPAPAPAPAKKPAAKAPAKAPAKPAAKPAKPAPAPKAAVPAPKPVPAPPAAKPAAPAPVKPAALKGKDAVRARILAQRAKPAKPAAFSLDEVLAIAKTVEKTAPAPAPVALIATKAGKTAPLPAHALQPPKPTTVRAASLADILGFNPKSKASHAENEEDAIPEKFKRYYKLLIELRNHVTGQVDQHSEETLKRSAKEDSGDLSSYGTDGGTDSFDRDFALSLVANEQEALAEVEAAIQRIKNGTYGVCEHTQQPINKERLLAVPFTRYTAAAMKEIEKTRYKVRGQTGILGEGEEGGPKVEDDSGE
jgi:RNA polymerase-binding transcription factor DksA